MSPRQTDLQLFDQPQRAPAGDRRILEAIDRAKKRTRRVDYEAEYAYQCRAHKLPEPVEQFYFAQEMDRKFRADFAWPKYKLLVEIQGGIWRPGGGAHSHPIDIERDVERLQYVAQLRYTMLPLLPKQVMSGYAIELTQRVLEKLGWVPP